MAQSDNVLITLAGTTTPTVIGGTNAPAVVLGTTTAATLAAGASGQYPAGSSASAPVSQNPAYIPPPTASASTVIPVVSATVLGTQGVVAASAASVVPQSSQVSTGTQGTVANSAQNPVSQPSSPTFINGRQVYPTNPEF